MKIKINYIVPEQCRASADLLDANGNFIRNFWNQKQLVYVNRTYSETFDDKDNLPEGTDYKLRLTTNNITSKWMGVIGNTSRQQSGPGRMSNMCQAQDWDSGRDNHYFTTGYNEQKTSCYRMPKSNMHTQVAIFPDRGMNGFHVVVKDGTVYWGGADLKTKSYADEFAERFIDKLWTLTDACVGYPDNIYAKMKANSSYCLVGSDDKFAGYRKPEYTRPGFVRWFDTYLCKDTWCNTFAGIWATRESDNTEVDFLFGKPYAPHLGMTYKSMIIYEGDLGDMTGLAVSDYCIYAAYGGRDWGLNSADLIRVYSIEGKLINEFKCEAPRKMIVVDDKLYYCSRNALIRATIDRTGSITPDGVEFRFDKLWTTADVACMKLTNEIVLASTDGSVRYFDRDLNERSVKGELTNYWANPVVYDNKFYWEDWRSMLECFIAIDLDGKTFIGDGGNQRIQVFDRDFEFLFSMGWLSTSYHVGAIDADPTRVFSEYLEFSRDPDYPDELRWSLKMNWGYLVETDWDDMYHTIDMPFILGGKTYARMQSITSNNICLVELDPEYGVRYLNKVYTNSKDKTLIYPDGCIYKDETSGAVKIKKWQFLYIDTDGTFRWAAPVMMINTPTPPSGVTYNNMCKRYTEIWNNKLFLYNAHVTEEHTHLTVYDIIAGTFHNGFPSTHNAYRGEYPADRLDIGQGVVYPGGQLVVVNGFIYCNHHGEFWDQGQTNKWHVFDENLVSLHTYGTETKSIRKQGIPKPAPMMAGNSFSGNVVKMGDNYYLYHNDESHNGGIHCVCFKNLESVKRYEFPAKVWNGVDPATVVYPLKELPESQVIKSGDGGWIMEPEEGYNISSTDQFIVYTGIKFLSLTEPSDLWVKFRSPNRRCIVSYPLEPITPSKWSLSGMVNYEGNYHARSDSMACKLQIVDADNRMMFEMYPTIDYRNKIVRLYINDQMIFELPESKAERILDYFQVFSVWCNNSILTAKFANYSTVILGSIESPPAKLRVLIYSGSITFDQQISLIKLKFNKR